MQIKLSLEGAVWFALLRGYYSAALLRGLSLDFCQRVTFCRSHTSCRAVLLGCTDQDLVSFFLLPYILDDCRLMYSHRADKITGAPEMTITELVV